MTIDFSKASLPLLTVTFLIAGTTHAKELVVSPTGEYPTIKSAIVAVQPGDVIKLSPQDAPYREAAIFHNVKGTQAKPVIFDGQGAVIDMGEPLNKGEYEEMGHGLYKVTKMPIRVRFAKNDIARLFLLFDGEINRYGAKSEKG